MRKHNSLCWRISSKYNLSLNVCLSNILSYLCVCTQPQHIVAGFREDWIHTLNPQVVAIDKMQPHIPFHSRRRSAESDTKNQSIRMSYWKPWENSNALFWSQKKTLHQRAEKERGNSTVAPKGYGGSLTADDFLERLTKMTQPAKSRTLATFVAWKTVKTLQTTCYDG